ncbi:hypothetical protein P7C73_g1002, partial [Tremellales sp. Uapishka_1]
MASLQYALGLHNSTSPYANPPYPPQPPMNTVYAPYIPAGLPSNAWHGRIPEISHMPLHQQQHPQPAQYHYPPPTPPPLFGGQGTNRMQQQQVPQPDPRSTQQYQMKWDPEMLARYAEFQLQQSHQKQQRALLQKQREQLAELGIPVEETSLLDELFGSDMLLEEDPQAQSHTHPDHKGQDTEFVWPMVNGNGNGNGIGIGGAVDNKGYNWLAGLQQPSPVMEDMARDIESEGKRKDEGERLGPGNGYGNEKRARVS